MLTNMENQLREQKASERFDEVLDEIPRVREDLGFIPLVTPTSQIVGTQAVLNVLTGGRYKSISNETAAVLRGEYGATPAPVNGELQERVLKGDAPVTCRPADLLEPELEKLSGELQKTADEQKIPLTEGDRRIDDVLTYALFPQIGLKFLRNRGNPEAFEPAPTGIVRDAVTTEKGEGLYTVTVEGKSYTVTVADGGDITSLNPVTPVPAPADSAAAPAPKGEPVSAPLAGNIFKVLVRPGERVSEGQTIIVLEAMKMETSISAPRAGLVTGVTVKEGDSVSVGDPLLSIA